MTDRDDHDLILTMLAEGYSIAKAARTLSIDEDEVRAALTATVDNFRNGQALQRAAARRGRRGMRRALPVDRKGDHFAESGMRRARQLSRRSGKTEHIYGEASYQAGKWPGLRRVIIKAEVVRAADKDPKDNPRFVITNMKQSPQWIYEHVYCQRGDIENRIKELHKLEIDRTSCTSFWANQFRVLLTAAAYVLMQELRLRAAGTACARAQVCMLRERLLKLGARVLVSVRRVVVHLPASFPFLPAFRCVALALGAATG